MSVMTQAEIIAARHRLAEQPRGSGVIAHADPAPEMEPIATPQRVEVEASVPWHDEPVSLKLRQFTGEFALPRPGERAGGALRAVTENDVEEIALWAIPRFAQRHPRCTLEGMLPFIKMAISSNSYHIIRTDNAVGCFMHGRTPWEPAGTVFDVFVAGRDRAESDAMIGHQVVRIYRSGLEWARSLSAVEFRFCEDNGYDLGAIARRIGMDSDRVVLYRKSLVVR